MKQIIKKYGDENNGPAIYCLTDVTATFPFPAPAVMPTVSAAEWAVAHQQYPASFVDGEKLVAQVTCYLIRQGGQTILVDTGLGENFTVPTGERGHGQLLQQLATIGVPPAAIDLVFHTHLHPDHVGWNLSGEADELRPTFPNARHLAPRLDWAMYETLLAAKPDAADHILKQLLPLEQLGKLTLVEGECALSDGICALPTPGHSPGHMSLLVNIGDGEQYLIAGDAFFHPLQLTAPTHHTGMDAMADAAQANATRTQLVARIQQEGWLVSACHFYTPAFGRLVDDGQGWYWQPI